MVTAVNPQTGERVELKNNQWVPIAPQDVPRETQTFDESMQLLNQIDGQQPIQTDRPKPEPVEEALNGLEDKTIGGVEALGTVATGAIAEPIAGLAGLASLPFTDIGQANKNIESVREALTFVPRTEAGMQALQRVAETLQPVTEAIGAAEEATGGAGFRAAGPVGGAVGATVPAAAMMAAGPLIRPIATAIKGRTSNALTTSAAKKALNESAPTIEGLKDAARNVYDRMDNAGITVRPGGVDRLSKSLQARAKREGFNKRIHPKVSAALDEFQSVEGRPQSLSEVDTLRRVAQSAARSLEPDEARIGSIIVNQVDDFLDNVKPSDLTRGNIPAKEVGAQFRDARQLWRRAKKSELLQESFEKAQNQATGFENGIRVQFRSILNNKKKSRGFTPDELDAMRQVVRGTGAQNLAKMLGRFGFSEGQASNMLMGSAGIAGGAAVGGPVGAVAVPALGTLSRNLAQKLTRKGAEATDRIVRAGNNGLEVAKAYLRATKPGERSAQELTELLLRPDMNLQKLKSAAKSFPVKDRNMIGDAVFLTGALQSQKEQEQ